jgi:hypothetical protein
VRDHTPGLSGRRPRRRPAADTGCLDELAHGDGAPPPVRPTRRRGAQRAGLCRRSPRLQRRRAARRRGRQATVRTSNAEAWRSKTRWPRAADPLAWFPPDLRWSAAPNPWLTRPAATDSDDHAARTPTYGSSRTARPRSRSGANSAALQHGREELAQPRRPSAAPSVVQRCRQACFTRSTVIGTSPASVPPCAAWRARPPPA